MSLDEPRLIVEYGLAARIAALAAPVLKSLELRLVRVRISGLSGRAEIQIMAERADGTMHIEDCQRASRALAPIIDVEGGLARGYNLEMSSPGIDRPLVRKSDFEKWSGQTTNVTLRNPSSGRRRYRGLVRKIDNAAVMLDAVGSDGAVVPVELELAQIDNAQLVITDQLLQAAAGAGPKQKPDQNANMRDADMHSADIASADINVPKDD